MAIQVQMQTVNHMLQLAMVAIVGKGMKKSHILIVGVVLPFGPSVNQASMS